MRVMLDTNVILDILQKREPFFAHAYQLMKLAAEETIECMISASAITDLFYILRKALQNSEKAKESIEDLTRLVSIADVLADDVYHAIASNMTDFEDALLAAVAARCRADVIVTRNGQAFVQSPIPALSPADFLNGKR